MVFLCLNIFFYICGRFYAVKTNSFSNSTEFCIRFHLLASVSFLYQLLYAIFWFKYSLNYTVNNREDIIDIFSLVNIRPPIRTYKGYSNACQTATAVER